MWILLALGASLLWGLTYVLNEQVYKRISVITSLAIQSLAMGLLIFMGVGVIYYFNK